MKYKTEYQMLNVADIIPAPYNPREDIASGSPEYAALRQSIVEHGLVEPPVVNLYNMHCVGGNQRLTVVRDLGWSQVLCSVINQPDELQEKKLCLALNRIDGRWDNDKLAVLLNDDEVLHYTTGFNAEEVALYRQLTDTVEPNAGEEATYLAQLESGVGDNAVSAELVDKLASASTFAEVEEPMTVVKIGHLSFKCELALYDRLLGSIRAAGIFEKNQIIQEFKRRLFADD